MPISPTTYNQGDAYWCDPDPLVVDTEGSEQKGDRIWVVLSVPRCHRGRCLVAVPLSQHVEKAGGHLIKIPQSQIIWSAARRSGHTNSDRAAHAAHLHPIAGR